MSKAEREKRYQAALENIPAPGGNGCHTHLLGLANRGIWARRTDEEMLAEIRASIPPGTRDVRDREIWGAIVDGSFGL